MINLSFKHDKDIKSSSQNVQINAFSKLETLLLKMNL